MDLFRVFRQFPDDEACIERIEAARWGDDPHCPHCNNPGVARKFSFNIVEIVEADETHRAASSAAGAVSA